MGNTLVSIRAAERRQEIVRLRHEEALSFRQIAAALHMDVSNVHADYHKAVRETIPVAEVTAERKAALDELDFYKREALAILRREHALVQWGKPIINPSTGEPFLDDAPVLQALNTLLKIERQKAAICGYDAPRQRVVQVVTQDMVNELVAQYREELGVTEGMLPR
jgi:hypothetical protein